MQKQTPIDLYDAKQIYFYKIVEMFYEVWFVQEDKSKSNIWNNISSNGNHKGTVSEENKIVWRV